MFLSNIYSIKSLHIWFGGKTYEMKNILSNGDEIKLGQNPHTNAVTVLGITYTILKKSEPQWQLNTCPCEVGTTL